MVAPPAPARRLRRILSAAIASCALLCLPACTSAVDHGRTYVRDDLEGIVLNALDAPDGTDFSDAVSGFQDVQEFARDQTELGRLNDDGFVVGYLALFAPTGHSEPGQGGPIEDPDAPFVQGITGLFRTPEGAASALHRFVNALKTEQLQDVRDVGVSDLGDEAFGVRGRESGTTVLVYTWRVGNLVLGVVGVGQASTEAIVGPLAQVVQGRAGS